MKLEPGMLIETNYSGPYRIKSVTRGCTCPNYVDTINLENPPPQSPHIHIVCSNPDKTGEFYLNGYDEETLQSLDKSYCESDKLEHDYITILEQDKPIQKTFF
jgi:hypothetical protein